MSPPRPKQLDLAKGTVILVADFKTFGFEPKDKYLFIIGHDDPAHVLAFVISSQSRWAQHPFLGRELVHIPAGTLPSLNKESWIQCFHTCHRLSIADLQAQFEQFQVEHKGNLPPEFLKKVRTVIEYSDVLKAYEIDDCLDAIDHDKSKIS